MITSPQNEKLKLVRRLRTSRGRGEGLFVTEGEDLLEAGLAAGREPEVLLVKPESSLDGEEVEPALLDSLSDLGSGTRAIAVWRALEEPGVAEGRPVVYLHGVSDPGNVGSIVRTVDALLEGCLVLGPGTADPLGSKAVRASMGAIFRQPISRAAIRTTPTPRIALVSRGGGALEETLADLQPKTLCLGSERSGLPDEVLDECDGRATIAMRPGGSESLNVAAAAAIATYAISSLAVKSGADHA